MAERKGVVKVNGKPFTLLGNSLKKGQKMPDATVVDENMEDTALSGFIGDRVLIVSAVSSIDTSVCDLETREFNERTDSMSRKLQVVTISMDLPFAQKRWCGVRGINSAKLLSDYRYADFGTKTGTLIKELRLLARTVFIVDKKGIIQYIEIVPELTEEPDYNRVLKIAKDLI